MKTLIAVITITAAQFAFAGIPKSNGKDLECRGSAEIRTPAYPCETDYGPGTCSDDSADFNFLLNTLKGDLSDGLAGQIAFDKIYGSVSYKKDPELSKILKRIVKQIAGEISYKDKNVAVTLNTPLGLISKTEQIDFSAGIRQPTVLLVLPNSDKFGFVLVNELNLEVAIVVVCGPGNNLHRIFHKIIRRCP